MIWLFLLMSIVTFRHSLFLLQATTNAIYPYRTLLPLLRPPMPRRTIQTWRTSAWDAPPLGTCKYERFEAVPNCVQLHTSMGRARIRCRLNQFMEPPGYQSSGQKRKENSVTKCVSFFLPPRRIKEEGISLVLPLSIPMSELKFSQKLENTKCFFFW